MDQGNIMAQARQAMQGAQGGQPPMPPQALPPKAQLPVPSPQVALQLAQLAQTLDPHVLGTLIWRALKQHGESLNAQGINDLGGGAPQGPMPPPTPGIPGGQ